MAWGGPGAGVTCRRGAFYPLNAPPPPRGRCSFRSRLTPDPPWTSWAARPACAGMRSICSRARCSGCGVMVI